MVAMLALSMPFAISAVSGSSDALISIDGDVKQGTITPDGGNIHVVLRSTESNAVSITVTVYKDGVQIGETVCMVPANGTATADVYIKAGGLGEHNITIKCTPATYFGSINETTAVVIVTQSVWSNWTTYIAIIVVAILIVAAAALHMRSVPKVKADTTFTELEQKKAPRSGETRTTERRKYSDSKDAAPVKESKKEAKKETFTEMAEKKESEKKETKKETFTEMAEKREAKKEAKKETFTEAAEKKETKKESAKAEKTPEPEEEKKIKYVSSRRR